MHSLLFSVGISASLVSAASAVALVPRDCTYSVVATSTDTCASLAKDWGLGLQQFEVYNPQVGIDCSGGVFEGETYCVEQNFGLSAMPTESAITPPSPPPSTTDPGSSVTTGAPTTTAVDATPTAPNGSPIPSPVQDGISPDCISFYKVVKGDTCAKVVQKYSGITIDDFYSWNPAVGTDCSGLWLDTYVCVGTTASATRKPSSTPAHTSATGSAAPSPTQDGLTSKCNRFYEVVKGDTCAKIVAKYGTFSLNDFYGWNPAVGTDCSGLWVDTYVCVGVPGTPTVAPPAKPSPTQDGLDASCNSYYKVAKGDTCQKIVDAHKSTLTLANFYKWNPAIGTDCGSLFLDYYVCIGIGKKRRAIKLY
ncbi:hypothetical protein SBRCBS47491_007814 [Sporothrix bragantina]|uniref:LysM domain-containing protein n=1 Tax=Sporothrix bragantina TaxID=671064 RepID=A0ABP0CJ50_9PEZI